MVALVPVHCLVAGAGIEPTSFWLMRPTSYPELYPAIILAEGVGIEPTEPFYLFYGLANRCLTIRPTLQLFVLYIDTTLMSMFIFGSS